MFSKFGIKYLAMRRMSEEFVLQYFRMEHLFQLREMLRLDSGPKTSEFEVKTGTKTFSHVKISCCHK